jgi:integrase
LAALCSQSSPGSKSNPELEPGAVVAWLQREQVEASEGRLHAEARRALRGQGLAAIERWRKQDPGKRGRRPERPLGPTSINKSLALLARMLDEAVEYGHLATNPAAGKRRRLRQVKPTRTWLEPHEAQAVLDAAGSYRPHLATMILAGLRVGELCSLRWRDVDLAGAKLRVRELKTAAGVRVVDVSPMLLDELKLHKASARHAEPDDLVFGTSKGTAQNRNNLRIRAVGKAVERANATLVAAGLAPIGEGVTNHSLRRTFASLLYEAGASPAYVMSQMGHSSSSLALEVYARKMARSRDTGERMDALLRGADWAQMGTNGSEPIEPFPVEKTKTAVVRRLS